MQHLKCCSVKMSITLKPLKSKKKHEFINISLRYEPYLMKVIFCSRWAYPEAMAKAGFYHQVSLRWQSTPTLWTPTWYKQFFMSCINPLNTDTGVMDTWYKNFHFFIKKLNITSTCLIQTQNYGLCKLYSSLRIWLSNQYKYDFA